MLFIFALFRMDPNELMKKTKLNIQKNGRNTKLKTIDRLERILKGTNLNKGKKLTFKFIVLATIVFDELLLG